MEGFPAAPRGARASLPFLLGSKLVAKLRGGRAGPCRTPRAARPGRGAWGLPGSRGLGASLLAPFPRVPRVPRQPRPPAAPACGSCRAPVFLSEGARALCVRGRNANFQQVRKWQIRSRSAERVYGAGRAVFSRSRGQNSGFSDACSWRLGMAFLPLGAKWLSTHSVTCHASLT